MGIYCVVSKTCNCKGLKLINQNEITITEPCEKHDLVAGNIIYYKLQEFLLHVFTGYQIKDKTYNVKILNVDKMPDETIAKLYNTIIKIEVTDESFRNKVLDESKQKYFMNNEPMFQKINDTTLHISMVYLKTKHTVELGWNYFDFN